MGRFKVQSTSFLTEEKRIKKKLEKELLSQKKEGIKKITKTHTYQE